jgi:hypothetical protein
LLSSKYLWQILGKRMMDTKLSITLSNALIRNNIVRWALGVTE